MNAKSFMIFLQIFLMCTIFVLLRHPAEAGIVTDRFPLQTYVDHQVDTYNNPGDARRAGYASANVDLIRVLEFRSDGWVRVQHPAGKNNRIVNRWCRITDLCADPNYSNRGVRVSGSHTVYRTRNNNVKFGSISNEEVIVLADNGSRAQILYRLDNGQGYKMGWVASSAVNSRTVQGNTINTNPIVQPAVRQTSNVVAPANGDYYLIPEANGGFALDVKGGGDAPEQTPLQLYNRHGEDAQIFTIQSIGGGWYTIKHKRTGRCVNVSWGSPNNGTGLWLYRDDGTASCHWRFLDAGNGSYNIQSRLSGNPILELQNNNVYAGGRIQLWQRHSGQAGRWKLVKVTSQQQTSTTSHNPEGVFDTVVSSSNNHITISGWAFDRDDPSKALEIHVYVGGSSAGGEGHGRIFANQSRPDVGRAYPGVGNNHGFAVTISTNKTGSQPVHVYAINIGGGENKELSQSPKTVNIKPEHTSNINEFPQSMYLTQIGSTTCTLSASAMMLKGKMYLNGESKWNSLTENTIKGVAWIDGQGLKHSWSYENYRITRGALSGVSNSVLRNILDNHPEGIVLYCGKIPHAVWVNSYNGDTFYAGDPLKAYAGSKRLLSSTYLGKKYGSQQNILSNVTAYWYIQ